MDLILIEGDRQAAERVENALQRPPGTLVRVAELHVDEGLFWPGRRAGSTLLVGFDRPDHVKAKVIARLWALDGPPWCHVVTTAGSAGERLLVSLFGAGLSSQDGGLPGPPVERPRRPGAPPLRLRNLHGLPLERVLALERLLRRSPHA